MQHESKKHLHDILKACEAILEFIAGKGFDDYDNDLLLRSAIERQLMIVGEALNQAVHEDPDIADCIEDVREVINLRNVIVHGYAVVENATIWGVVQEDVPRLYEQVEDLLGRE